MAPSPLATGEVADVPRPRHVSPPQRPVCLVRSGGGRHACGVPSWLVERAWGVWGRQAPSAASTARQAERAAHRAP
jgi:hypothetical protein